MALRIFGWSFALTAAGLLAAGLLWGAEGFGVVLLLSILEVSLSFDNAVVNATVLKRMTPFWQRIFLTVGVLIAVFGMRLLFPLLVVGLTAKLGPATLIELALDSGRTYEGHTYGEYLAIADPAISAFGGIFLLMIFLDFMVGEKDFHWLRWIERPMERIGRLEALPTVISLLVLALASQLFAGERAETVLLAGLLGLATYLTVNGLAGVFESNIAAERDKDAASGESAKGLLLAGKAAFFLFLYLEVLDASFSFDGVVGAFAITQDIFKIALGLGIGALYIRSLTVFLVRKGTLDDYVYLEHGAHYAIGALSLIMLARIEYSVPEIVTGLIGVAFIAAALGSSLLRNRRRSRT